MLISEQYLKERGFTSQEIRVLFLRYSKEGVKIRTSEEVGRKLKLTRQRINQIEQKAISKLLPEIREQLVESLRPPTLKEMEAIERRFLAKGHSYRRIANKFPLTLQGVAGCVRRGLKKIESRKKAGVLSKREIKILEKAEELTGESSIIQAHRVLRSLLMSRKANKRYEQMGPTDVEKIAKKTEKSDQWVYWAIKKLVKERGFSPPERRQRGSGEARIVLSNEMKRALLQLAREQNQS